MKSKAPEFCPKHPKEKLVEVQAPEGLGDALACPVGDCNTLVILDRKKPAKIQPFLNDQDVGVRLAHGKIGVNAEGSRTAVLEFRLYLNRNRLRELHLPDSLIEAYELMDRPGCLQRADLDLEIPEQTMEFRLTPKQKGPSLKLVSVAIFDFKLKKIEHKGTGNPEDKIQLLFQTRTDFDRDLAIWLSAVLGTELILRTYPTQRRLPETEP